MTRSEEIIDHLRLYSYLLGVNRLYKTQAKVDRLIEELKNDQ